MSENLYAPPQAELGPESSPAIGSGTIEIGRCVSEAWARTWASFPLWLGFGVLWTLAVIAVSVTGVGLIFAVPVLFWGGYVFVLHMYDGGAALRDMFAGFSRYGEALGSMLGYTLLTVLLSIPGYVVSQIGAASQDLTLIAVGYAIAIVLSIFVASRLNFVPFLVIDRGLGLGEAIRQSWDRTSPLIWKVAGLTGVMFLLGLFGTLALLIGIIPATVMGFLIWSSAYRQVFGGPAR